MNTRIVYFSAICFLTVSLAFCVAAADPVVAKKADQHPIWEVKGRKATVYLLGSVHFLQASNYPLAEPIEKAFRQSSIAVFETDIDAMKSSEGQKKLLSQAMLPEGKTLATVLSPSVYAEFTNYLTGANIPSALLERFRPGLAAVTLTVLELQRMGLDPELGVDQHFHKRAKQDGKKIVPLETVDFQVDLLTNLVGEDGEGLIKATLKEVKNTRTAFSDIVQAWRTGNTEQLARLMNDALKDTPSVYKRMISDRNRNWIPKIMELVNGDLNAIVIVGAGHLVGEDNVIELLQKQSVRAVQK